MANKILYDDSNLWRKRVIGCISGYFRQENHYQDLCYDQRLEVIKATANRIAKVEHFNEISVIKLRNIYNEFKRKQ